MQIEFEWVSSQLGRGLGMPDHRCQAHHTSVQRGVSLI